MKFNRLMKYKSEMFFFENHAENETGRIIPNLFLFFEKFLRKVKESGQHLGLIYFGRPLLGHAIKTNYITFQIAYPEICSILIS